MTAGVDDLTTVTITTPSGSVRGELATPTTPGPWPGVVVLHEAFGLTDDIRSQSASLRRQRVSSRSHPTSTPGA